MICQVGDNLVVPIINPFQTPIFETMALLGKNDYLQLMCFQTYGTQGHLYLRGRAFEDEYIDLAQKSTFQLVRNTWRRFETDEVRNTGVAVTLGDKRTLDGKTDTEGYYLIDEGCENLS
ncbi:MAG: hypothetical protein AB3N16_04460, partial [Flavobacteriaceae bacterium]